MTTNFYYKSDETDKSHIGLRASAGPYCHNCNVTLCVGGPNKIGHPDAQWFNSCPSCGAENEESVKSRNTLILNSYGKAKRSFGVAPTNLFIWALPKYELDFFLLEDKHVVIYDEYYKNYSRSLFETILKHDCKVQIYEVVYTEFS